MRCTVIQIARRLATKSLADFALGDLCIDRAIETTQHLHKDLHREAPQYCFFLSTDHATMLIFRQFAICNLGETFDYLFADVLLPHVTIIVDKDLQEHHRVLTDFVKDAQDQVLVVVAGRA